MHYLETLALSGLIQQDLDVYDRLKALNASSVFLATMARRTRAQVGEGLRGDARVLLAGLSRISSSGGA